LEITCHSVHTSVGSDASWLPLRYTPYQIVVMAASFHIGMGDSQSFGNGAVTVVDTAELEHSSMAYASEGAPVEMIGARLHILTAGCTYDLSTRKAQPAPRNRDS
jgi:hypothetical protein